MQCKKKWVSKVLGIFLAMVLVLSTPIAVSGIGNWHHSPLSGALSVEELVGWSQPHFWHLYRSQPPHEHNGVFTGDKSEFERLTPSTPIDAPDNTWLYIIFENFVVSQGALEFLFRELYDEATLNSSTVVGPTNPVVLPMARDSIKLPVGLAGNAFPINSPYGQFGTIVTGPAGEIKLSFGGGIAGNCFWERTLPYFRNGWDSGQFTPSVPANNFFIAFNLETYLQNGYNEMPLGDRNFTFRRPDGPPPCNLPGTVDITKRGSQLTENDGWGVHVGRNQIRWTVSIDISSANNIDYLILTEQLPPNLRLRTDFLRVQIDSASPVSIASLDITRTRAGDATIGETHTFTIWDNRGTDNRGIPPAFAGASQLNFIFYTYIQNFGDLPAEGMEFTNKVDLEYGWIDPGSFEVPPTASNPGHEHTVTAYPRDPVVVGGDGHILKDYVTFGSEIQYRLTINARQYNITGGSVTDDLSAIYRTFRYGSGAWHPAIFTGRYEIHSKEHGLIRRNDPLANPVVTVNNPALDALYNFVVNWNPNTHVLTFEFDAIGIDVIEIFFWADICPTVYSVFPNSGGLVNHSLYGHEFLNTVVLDAETPSGSIHDYANSRRRFSTHVIDKTRQGVTVNDNGQTVLNWGSRVGNSASPMFYRAVWEDRLHPSLTLSDLTIRLTTADNIVYTMEDLQNKGNVLTQTPCSDNPDYTIVRVYLYRIPGLVYDNYGSPLTHFNRGARLHVFFSTIVDFDLLPAPDADGVYRVFNQARLHWTNREGNLEYRLTAGAEYFVRRPVIDKDGEAITVGAAEIGVRYHVNINPFGMDLSNITLTDVFSSWLLLDPNSIRIYEAEITFGNNGSAGNPAQPTFTKIPNLPPVFDAARDSYQNRLSVYVGPVTSTFVLDMSSVLQPGRAYILVYDTYFRPGAPLDDFINTIVIDDGHIRGETESAHVFTRTNAGGGVYLVGTPVTADIRIKKSERNTEGEQTRVEGIRFDLIAEISPDILEVISSVTTCSLGEAAFGIVRNNRRHWIVEVLTPEQMVRYGNPTQTIVHEVIIIDGAIMSTPRAMQVLPVGYSISDVITALDSNVGFTFIGEHGMKMLLEVENVIPPPPENDEPGNDNPGNDNPGNDNPGNDEPGNDNPGNDGWTPNPDTSTPPSPPFIPADPAPLTIPTTDSYLQILQSSSILINPNTSQLPSQSAPPQYTVPAPRPNPQTRDISTGSNIFVSLLLAFGIGGLILNGLFIAKNKKLMDRISS